MKFLFSFIILIINFIILPFEIVGKATLKFLKGIIITLELVGKFTLKMLEIQIIGLSKIGSSKLITGLVFILLLLVGPLLIVMDVYSTQKISYDNEDAMEAFFSEVANENEIIDETIDQEVIDETKEEEKFNSFEYVLEIPKINLKQGVVDADEKATTIHRYVSALYQTDKPNIQNGNFVLAAHRGNRATGYFNNLHKLSVGDEIKIYYRKKLYIYYVTKNFEINETNFSILDRQNKKTIITLFTCKKGDNTKRIVIQAQLNEIAVY
ncbi:MAG: sortase [Bacilli bacterium]